LQVDFEKAVTDKNAKVQEIKKIEGEMIAKELEIKKIEEIIQLCKVRKAFLDELAVSAGKKQKWVPGGT
jgi:hypothetical protein